MERRPGQRHNEVLLAQPVRNQSNGGFNIDLWRDAAAHVADGDQQAISAGVLESLTQGVSSVPGDEGR
ncbi:MAG TPA: hypothetical protein ACQGQJ_06975 [Xylella fastidiosa subsp. multiplex]